MAASSTQTSSQKSSPLSPKVEGVAPPQANTKPPAAKPAAAKAAPMPQAAAKPPAVPQKPAVVFYGLFNQPLGEARDLSVSIDDGSLPAKAVQKGFRIDLHAGS